MKIGLELRWTYAPEELFEEDFIAVHSGCDISIGKGTVVALIEGSSQTDSQLRVSIEEYVANIFLGAQVQSHTLVEISKPSLTSIHADGSKGVIIECQPGRATVRGYPPDLRYTLEDGTIVDTREERIRQKRKMAEFAALLAPTDQTLSRMLKSYRAAVFDPADELVHLYEIRDSVVAAFGTQSSALSALQLSKRAWSRLGQLCNELPLKEGRHRGKAAAELREATYAELAEARALSVSFIAAYTNYIRSRIE